MELTEAPRGDRPFVESYGPGGFRIGGERWTGSVLILADRVVAWELGDAAVPDAEALAAAFAGERTELLILGLGAGSAAVSAALPPAARAALRKAGLAVEAMDTGAACRTYNLLAGEGRAVGAALKALPAG
ncbi:MAG: Mth938-like domain-containing protein [Rhodospirillaceae bacterium]|nr:Mth938-like domain-containing protein [Rhodospirillaceae bacterium]